MHHSRSSLLTLAAVLMAASVSYAAEKPMAEPAGAKTSISATSIHQEVDFIASPDLVYSALTDSAQFAAFSGRPAQIDRSVGGASTLFGGHIVARNVELVPGKRVVQAWRVVGWPDGMWSIARFELQAKAGGTHLVFDHSSFPDGLRDHLAEGWEANYWSLMKKYFTR